ncbi:hypothetical protein, partial [Xanthomonas sp. SHU 166]|uniref:hypothetical protein n=1 Tax=Xanthomonas sp. SHU 166 TaxID=1591170 RepID=UPI001E62DEED
MSRAPLCPVRRQGVNCNPLPASRAWRIQRQTIERPILDANAGGPPSGHSALSENQHRLVPQR